MLKLDNFQICCILLSYTLYFITFLALVQFCTTSDGALFDRLLFSKAEFRKIIFLLISIIGGLPPFSLFSIKLFSLYTIFSSSYLLTYLLFLLYNIVFIVFYYNHFLVFTKALKFDGRPKSKRGLVLGASIFIINSLSIFCVNLVLL